MDQRLQDGNFSELPWLLIWSGSMKKAPTATRAILVFECPWELDSSDSNRASVLPFMEGVAKLAGDTELYHANFYDKSSFEHALRYLCKVKFANTTVYIAAHGLKKRVGNVKLEEMLKMIAERSRSCNITGIMLGSCYVGENRAEMSACIQGTNLRWCAGYSSTANWLEGTLIDCSIVASMSELNGDDKDFKSRERMIQRLGEAISPYAESYCIGENYKKKKICLRDSLRFIVQPKGQGIKPSDVTAEVFSAHKKCQLQPGSGSFERV